MSSNISLIEQHFRENLKPLLLIIKFFLNLHKVTTYCIFILTASTLFDLFIYACDIQDDAFSNHLIK